VAARNKMGISSSKEQGAARAFYSAGASASRAGERASLTHLRDASERAALPLREIPRVPEETSAQSLPVMASAADVRELVRLLKKRATGLTIVEAMNSEQKRLFDSRKIAAYEFWGIAMRAGDRLKLTPLGLEVARQLEPEALIHRTILNNIDSYRTALFWVFERGLDLVTHTEVAAYWRENYSEAIEEHDEKMTEASVVCFFHLCQAAELGTMTIGKRGQPARLYVERKELAEYLRSTENPSSSSSAVEIFTGSRLSEDQRANRQGASLPELESDAPAQTAANDEELRLFISHTEKRELVDQLEVTLGFANIPSAVVERQGAISTSATSAAGPVAEHLLEAMRQCNAAVIVVSKDDCSQVQTAQATLRQDVFVEIGAAFVFYERRVVLLWDESIPVPRNLQGLNRCEFKDGRLEWEDAVRLMRAIKELKG
jgi:hypothetical protein